MLRATAVGFACVIALGGGLALAGAGKGGGGGGGGLGGGGVISGGGGGVHSGGSGGGIGGGGAFHSSGPVGGGIPAGGGSLKSGGAGPGPGPVQTGRETALTRTGDHDRFFDRHHDHDHDRFRFRRFRFFPAFAFNNYYYTDTYYPDYSNCWEIHRVHTGYGWRLHRVWVCDYTY